MSVQETAAIASKILEELPDDTDEEEIRNQVETLIEEFQVPEEECRRTILDKYGDSTQQQNEDEEQDTSSYTKIQNAKTDDEWHNIKGKVIKIWEDTPEKISQTGLIADETDIIKFTSWKKSDVPELEKGQSYSLRGVVSDEYQGKYNIQLNTNTEVEKLDEDIDTDQNAETSFEGILIKIQDGSGLVKRCPHNNCTRVLQNGRCSEHEVVEEGEFDLRIKAVFDNGKRTIHANIPREQTEKLTGYTLDEAKKEAEEKLDISIILDKFRQKLVPGYYRIEGKDYGEMNVDNVEKIKESPDIDETLIEARGI